MPGRQPPHIVEDQSISKPAPMAFKIALLQQGIDPAEAAARILALTDDEVVQLGAPPGDFPAAGDMGMSGGWVILFVFSFRPRS